MTIYDDISDLFGEAFDSGHYYLAHRDHAKKHFTEQLLDILAEHGITFSEGEPDMYTHLAQTIFKTDIPTKEQRDEVKRHYAFMMYAASPKAQELLYRKQNAMDIIKRLEQEQAEMQDMCLNLGAVCRVRLNIQAQYGCRYADPRWKDQGFTYCGHGLRITGNCDDYHSMTIHRADAEEFVHRVKEARGE
jgi:hypothetical protein